MEEGDEGGDGRAEGWAAVGDKGRAASMFMPDLDGTGQTKAIPWPFPILNLLGSSLLLPLVSLHPCPGHIQRFLCRGLTYSLPQVYLYSTT